MLGIVDYGVGNLASVANAVRAVGERVEIERDPARLKSYDRLILPGVGAFGDAMEHLRTSGMREAVLEFAASGAPLLGICLGMQLLFEKSYEFGSHEGLGLVGGEIRRFAFGTHAGEINASAAEQTASTTALKVPHVGWNKVCIKRKSPLLNGLPGEFYLYFVHSFYAGDSNCAIGTTEYGLKFASIVQSGNIFGIQAHPEKSHSVGLALLLNFIRI